MGTVPQFVLLMKFIIFCPAFLLCLGSFGHSLTGALTCNGKICGFGTMNQCTSDGYGCRCLDNYTTPRAYRYNGHILQICRSTLEAPVTCGYFDKQICGFGTTYKCNVLGTNCVCDDNYFRLTILGDFIQICKQKCPNQMECPVNYQCVGYYASTRRCECAAGYTRSHGTGECEDTDECRDDGICDDKNNTVCHNTAGSFDCVCLAGYSTSVHNTPCHAAPDGGISAWVYIGVTIALLTLLSLIIVALLIRRRRSKQTCEGTPKFPNRAADVYRNCNDTYENVSLENEDQGVTSSKHQERKPSLVGLHSNPEKNEARSGMKQYVASVDKELAGNQSVAGPVASTGFTINGKWESPEEQIYSGQLEENIHFNKNKVNDNVDPFIYSNAVTFDETLMAEDSGTYNHLEIFSLNAKDKHITKKIMTKDRSTDMNSPVTSKECFGRHASNPAPDQNSNEEQTSSKDLTGHSKTNDTPYSNEATTSNKGLKGQDKTTDIPVDYMDSKAYYDKLESCNLKTAAEFRVAAIGIPKDQITYNRITLPTKDVKFQDCDAYNTLNCCNLNSGRKQELDDETKEDLNAYNTLYDLNINTRNNVVDAYETVYKSN